MLPETKRKQTEARETASLVEVTRTLEEARDALRGYEVAALAGVAATLAEAAERLAHIARELHEMSREEWMTPDTRRPVTSTAPRPKPSRRSSPRKACRSITFPRGSPAIAAPSSTSGCRGGKRIALAILIVRRPGSRLR